jgi:hypothetical protein
MLRSIYSLAILLALFSCAEEEPIHLSLINLVEEPPGINCGAGGLKIETGFDINDDKTLSNDEVIQTKYACDAQDDKQIRLQFGAPGFSTRESEFVLPELVTSNIIKFNKLNYTNVASIVFMPSLYAGRDPMIPSETTACVAQLYNLTDNVPIAGTELMSDVNAVVFKESGNIYDALPAKEITLAIRIRSTNNKLSVQTGMSSYLFINKK